MWLFKIKQKKKRKPRGQLKKFWKVNEAKVIYTGGQLPLDYPFWHNKGFTMDTNIVKIFLLTNYSYQYLTNIHNPKY